MWITRQEAAKITGLSLNSLDRYKEKGRIKSYRSGRSVYLDKDDVKALAAMVKDRKPSDRLTKAELGLCRRALGICVQLMVAGQYAALHGPVRSVMKATPKRLMDLADKLEGKL